MHGLRQHLCLFFVYGIRHTFKAKFVELTDGYKLEIEIIGKDKEELLSIIYPYYEEIAIDLENRTAYLDRGYENLTTEVSKQGELWHREIDIIINNIKLEMSEIKVKQREILQKHMNDIK